MKGSKGPDLAPDVNVNVIRLPKSTKELSRNLFKGDCAFQVELEFGIVGFVKGGKPENSGKNPQSRGESHSTNNKFKPNIASTRRIESGPHWLEASA